ncbi:MAG TPA: hypothetical protein VME86_09115 [Acidobacteriaceae bacterium]|nr:hypothetical protein [Acidobacteriaceae bacterium]
MKKLAILTLLLFAACYAATPASVAQTQQIPGANAAKAKAELEAMLQAMGGQRWLALQNIFYHGRVSGFYQGKPTGEIEDYFEWITPSGQARIEYGKKHDDVEIFTGSDCFEATYLGKRKLPSDICDDFIRRRDHSINVALHVWMNDPNTLFIDDGQTLSERHLTDQVTLISANDESIVIQMDAQTHLPRSCTFQYRDPVYHDKDTDREEYDNYHLIEGFPTAFSITRFHNGDIVSQRYLYNAGYNVKLPPNGFDIDAIAAHIKK